MVYECKLLFLHTQFILSLNNEVSSLIHITYILDHAYTPASNTYDLPDSLTVWGEYINKYINGQHKCNKKSFDSPVNIMDYKEALRKVSAIAKCCLY